VRSNERYLSENRSMVEYWEKRERLVLEEGPEAVRFSWTRIQADLAWYRYETKLAEKISQAYLEGDWATYNHYLAKKGMLEWNIVEIFDEDESSPYCPYISPQEYFGSRWQKAQSLLEPEVQGLPYWFSERRAAIPRPEQLIFATDLHLRLYEADLPPLSPHGTSPWQFVFNYMRQGLPKILGLVVLLMTVNILHREKKSGAIKVSLQNPKARVHYIVRKVFLGFVSSLLVVAIPQIVMFLGLGFGKGYRGLNMPVLIDKGFLNWSIDPEHLRLLRWTDYFGSVGLSQYVPSYNGYTAVERMEFIPLWQFLLLALVALALFVLLCSVLGVLISILVKNEIFAQMTAVGVFALGSSLGRIFPKLKTTPWDIFSKANVIPILEGNHNSSYSYSLVAMAIVALLLMALAARLFRKQDITS
jgi:ABC-type transport system involved in multi-copper enzyme maturation permease subunit